MRILLLLLISYFVLTASCKNNQNTANILVNVPKPHHLIGSDTMINLLIEVQLAESFAQDKKINKDSLLLNDLYANALGKYKVSPQQFISSFTYYLSKPELLDEMYTTAIERISEKDHSKQ